MAFLIGGANSAADTGYDIDNSIRLNLPDEARLSNDPGGGSGSDGNRNVWSFSCWFKRSRLGDQQYLISAATDGNNYGTIKIGSNDKLYINLINSGSDQDEIITNAVFRDPAAWYHIVVAADKTEAAIGDGMKMWINGVAQTFGTTTYAQNEGYHFSRPGKTIYIGVTGGNNDWWQGYMADVHFVDGTQKAATDFGTTDEDSGIWKPKKYSGAYGTYGYFLEFKETGTSENSSGIGADTSGNDEHFAVTNLIAADQCTDTPTNNFCTLNSIAVPDNLSDYTSRLAEGACELSSSTVADSFEYMGTMPTNMKYYFECKLSTVYDGSNDQRAGVVSVDKSSGATTGTGAGAQAYYGGGGYISSVNRSGSAVATTLSGKTTWADNQIIGVAVDNTTNNDVKFYNNGVLQGTIAIVSTELYMPYFRCMGASGQTNEWQVNFGNPPYANSSDAADENGYGLFEYAPPSGYYALCTKNLAEYG